MNLHGFWYLAFLGLMLILSASLPHPRLRKAALLLASYFFYATWSPLFLSLLIACSLFNFIWGRVLHRRPTAGNLWVGLTVNISLLVFFKYAASLIGSLVPSIDAASAGLLLPVGISFYTFQAISSLIDIYRGYPERPSLVEYLLYIAFWPCILSGPICRLPEMLPQFRTLSRPSPADLSKGLQRILTGLFLKIVLADTLARGVSPEGGVTGGFDGMTEGWGTLDVWMLAVGFGFQIFFDFAGYSHIAIGSAQVFGLQLRENFNDPYLARTPTEFWNRWHMSLSSWIRDYLFFPLAVLGRSRLWRYLVVVLAMAVFGLWHGAGWTFLLWGIYQGLLLVMHRLLQTWGKSRPGPPAVPAWLRAASAWKRPLSLSPWPGPCSAPRRWFRQ